MMRAGLPARCLSAWIAVATCSPAFATPPAPPTRPRLPEVSEIDRNGNRVDDRLDDRLHSLRDRIAAARRDRRRDRLVRRLDESVGIELVFRDQVTQAQVEVFEAMGGGIDHVFQAVSHGWTGRLPGSRVEDLVSAMGDDLLVVQEEQEVVLHLDEATRSGRARPVWANGFAGSVSGYSGTIDTTIAFVDTGTDDSHADLADRLEYWVDFTTDRAANPVDFVGHGTHVAGIALGSGAAFGVGPGPLAFSVVKTAEGLPPGAGFLSLLHLPPAELEVFGTALWQGGGATVLGFLSRDNASLDGFTWLANSPVAGSPLSLAFEVSGDPAKQYAFGLPQNESTSVGDYVITANVTPYPSVGDGFPALRGVASGASWASAKVFTNTGVTTTSIVGEAFDHLLMQRQAHNIKIINASLGTSGPFPALRAKVNTLVDHGVVVVCSAGNSGPGTTIFELVGDPGRAALALTVGAANDANQLAVYSSSGPSPPSSDEDYKPDLLAPGGSVFQSDILSADSNDGDGPIEDQVADDYLGNQGTSMAAPFAAGAAALVIEAMQGSGATWDFDGPDQPLFVKMILLAAATETNAKRDYDLSNPSLGRAVKPKDLFEGYGLINVDAAIEAVVLPYSGGELVGSTNGGPFDRRAWGRRVELAAGPAWRLDLTVPATADYDFYLYSGEPDERGNPVLLASSTQAGVGEDEVIVLPAAWATVRRLFVKRVSGHGAWSIASSIAPVVCGDGVIEGEEECDSDNCCSDSCEIEGDGGPCDDGLFCTAPGTCDSGVCVAGGNPCAAGGECNDLCNEFTDTCADPAGTPCASDFDVCSDDVCDGGGNCVHLVAFGGEPCRPAKGVCDLEERCTGLSNSCPPDAYKPPSSVCRASSAVCDTAETCTGSTATCPLDAIASSSDVCRPAASSCDVAEFCTGTSIACPLQVVADAGTTCGSSDGNPCTDDICDGTSPLCQYLDNQAPCDNGFFCDGADTCMFGACLQHAGDPCPGADGDGDCSESCSEAADACVAPDPEAGPCTSTTTTLPDDVCGDANGDGEVTSVDALVALRAATGINACPSIRCDYTGDGKTTASDALAILRRAVGGQGEGQCGAGPMHFDPSLVP